MKKALTLSLVLNVLLALGIVYVGSSYLSLKEEVSDMTAMEANMLPPIVYTPEANFTAAEKGRIESRVLKPYRDYHECLNAGQLAAMHIQKADSPGYLYHVEIFGEDGTLASFLHGEPGSELEFYTPDLILKDCVETLPHADQLRDQAIEEYKG